VSALTATKNRKGCHSRNHVDCPLKIYSYDGNSALVEYMQDMTASKFGLEKFWSYNLKAFARTSGTAQFPSELGASELNALVTSTDTEDKRTSIPSSSAVLINVSVGTIDENIRHLRPDVVKIDTEGFDPALDSSIIVEATVGLNSPITLVESVEELLLHISSKCSLGSCNHDHTILKSTRSTYLRSI